MTLSYREKQKQQLKQHIFDTALPLFREHGFDNTSVAQITQACGIAKGTFFNHYAVKEALLDKFMKDVTKAGLDKTQQNPSDSAQQNVLNLMLNLFAAANVDSQIFRYSCELALHNPSLKSTDQALDRQLMAFMQQVMTQGVENGEISAKAPLDVLMPLLLGSLTMTAQEWAHSKGKGEGYDFVYEITRRINFLFLAATK
ncbi:MAG: TetR/AcrR family transcriptional regulator [Algicola sp.]|nr:TetR/AcrR family transcriptional regulator [Algicola sp.]